MSTSAAKPPAANKPTEPEACVDSESPAIGDGEPVSAHAPDAPGPAVAGHPVLGYVTARIVLLFVTGTICYFLGARGILLLVLAFLISGLLSFLLLSRQRAGMASVFGGYFRRINDRIDRSAAAEDDVVDIQEH